MPKIGCRHQCNTHAHHVHESALVGGARTASATRRAAPSGAAVEGRPGARGGWPRERRYQHRRVVSRPVSRETRVPTAAVTRPVATPELCVRHPRRSGLSRFTDGPAGAHVFLARFINDRVKVLKLQCFTFHETRDDRSAPPADAPRCSADAGSEETNW